MKFKYDDLWELLNSGVTTFYNTIILLSRCVLCYYVSLSYYKPLIVSASDKNDKNCPLAGKDVAFCSCDSVRPLRITCTSSSLIQISKALKSLGGKSNMIIDQLLIRKATDTYFHNPFFEGLAIVRFALNRNSINFISEIGFVGVSQTLYLDLAYNKIANLPTFSPNLNRVILLDVGFNEISSLEEETLQSFINLTTFYANNNRLSVIGRCTFCQAQKLRFLFLHNNKLPSLENKIFMGAHYLEVLNLNHNKIDFVEEQAFYNMTELRVLTMDYNLIKALKPESYKSLKKLRYFSVSHNSLIDLSKSSFKIFPELQIIRLNHNALSKFQAIPEKLSRILDISNNRISTLPSSFITKLPWLYLIRLDQNPWNCKCSLVKAITSIHDWFDKTSDDRRKFINFITDSSPRCYEPIEFNNVSLWDINADQACKVSTLVSNPATRSWLSTETKDSIKSATPSSILITLLTTMLVITSMPTISSRVISNDTNLSSQFPSVDRQAENITLDSGITTLISSTLTNSLSSKSIISENVPPNNTPTLSTPPTTVAIITTKVPPTPTTISSTPTSVVITTTISNIPISTSSIPPTPSIIKNITTSPKSEVNQSTSVITIFNSTNSTEPRNDTITATFLYINITTVKATNETLNATTSAPNFGFKHYLSEWTIIFLFVLACLIIMLIIVLIFYWHKPPKITEGEGEIQSLPNPCFHLDDLAL